MGTSLFFLILTVIIKFSEEVNNIERYNICGFKFENRIVGGSDSNQHSWPWIVLYFIYHNIN